MRPHTAGRAGQHLQARQCRPCRRLLERTYLSACEWSRHSAACRQQVVASSQALSFGLPRTRPAHPLQTVSSTVRACSQPPCAAAQHLRPLTPQTDSAPRPFTSPHDTRDLFQRVCSSIDATAPDEVNLQKCIAEKLEQSFQLPGGSLGPVDADDDLDVAYSLLGDRSDGSSTASTSQPAAPQQPQDRGQQRHQRHQRHKRQLPDQVLTSYLKYAATVADLEALFDAHSTYFNRWHVACLLNRLAKVPEPTAPQHHHSTQRMLEYLDVAFTLHIPTYGARELCNAVWSWGRLGHRPHPKAWAATYQALFGPNSQILEAAVPQAIVNLAWGLCRLGCSDSSAWSRLADMACRQMPRFNPFDMSNIAYAFAAADQYHMRLFVEVARCATARIAEFCPQDLSNMLWAFAHASHPNAPLFEAAAPAICRTLAGFNQQGLTNVIWAYATVQLQNVQLSHAISREALPRLHAFTPQNLSLMAWSMARLKQPDPQLYGAICSSAMLRLHAFKTKEIAILIFAFASAGFADSPLFKASTQLFIRQLQGSCNAQDLTNIAWAYATAKVPHDQLFRTVLNCAVDHLDQLMPNSIALSNVLWALGTMGYYHPGLYQRVAAHVATHGEAYDPGQLAAMLLSFASVGHYDRACCAAAAHGIARDLGGCTHQTLVNSSWALAVLGHRDLGFFSRVFREVGRRQISDLGARDYTQLFQTCMWLQDTGAGEGDTEAVLQQLPRAVYTRGRKLWQGLARQAMVSTFQGEVFRTLQDLGLEPAMETRTSDGMFSLDMTVTWRGVAVAVEANGDHHYLATHPDRPCGAKVLRDRCVARRGFRVLNIPALVWRSVAQGRQATHAYLRQALDGCVEGRPVGTPWKAVKARPPQALEPADRQRVSQAALEPAEAHQAGGHGSVGSSPASRVLRAGGAKTAHGPHPHTSAAASSGHDSPGSHAPGTAALGDVAAGAGAVLRPMKRTRQKETGLPVHVGRRGRAAALQTEE